MVTVATSAAVGPPVGLAQARPNDSNAPLLGHLIDAGEDRQQIEDDRAISMYMVGHS